MLDPIIIEEVIREDKERQLNENGRKKKSAKTRLFEQLLHEMYPMEAGYGVEKSKYTRLSDLIRILQDALWKIQDYERNTEQNPEDKDIYDTAKQNYENMVNSTIDRIKEVWNSAEEQPTEEEQPEQPEVSQDEQPGDIDWSKVTLQLQPESIIISPQNKEYYVMEVNENRAKLKEVVGGEIFHVDVNDTKRWKKK